MSAMRMSVTTKIVTGLTALSLIAGLTLSGIQPVSAQTAQPTPAPTTPATPAAPNTDDKPDKNADRAFLMKAGVQIAQALIQATLEQTGISQAELLKELFAGKTLTDIITAKGGTVSKVKDAARKTLVDAINALTDTGSFTKQGLITALDGILDRALTGEFRAQFAERVRAAKQDAALNKIGGVTVLIQETAKATKLSQRDLLKLLREGKTLNQIATDNKADPAAIIAAAITDTTTKINRAVKANKLKQEDADKLIATVPAEYTRLMNTVNPIENMLPGRNPNKGDKPGKAPIATPAAPATPSL